jgi:hypothetical protein
MKRCNACGETRPPERFSPRRSTCRDCINARARAKGFKTPYSRDKWLRSEYGITLDEYEQMLEAQGGRCALGHDFRTKPVVDHDHCTGGVRGLLCQGCNIALGHLRDDPARCEAAADYLEQADSGSR